MKHRNHIFLLQNVFNKITFNNPEQLRMMKFPGKEPDDPDPWSVFFSLIEENARPLLASCLGWGSGEKREEEKYSQSSGSGKKRGKKNKCGKKVQKRG